MNLGIKIIKGRSLKLTSAYWKFNPKTKLHYVISTDL